MSIPIPSFVKGLIWIAVIQILAAWPAFASDDVVCPMLDVKYGPYDYTHPVHRKDFLFKVERRHFSSKVQSLHPSGETGRLMGDIEYVLNWFPNHHGALDLLSRLAVREKSPKPLKASADIYCRFVWAKRVNPRDPMVPMIEGLHFFRTGKNAEARQALESAVKMAPYNATAYYNLGLVLVQLGDFSAAREHAAKAYELGFPLPGLRNQLARAGYPLP